MALKLVKPWTWFWGILAGFISGGASAFTTGPIAALFAPTEFNLKAGLANLLWFMLIVFVQAGLMNAMFYLAKAPVPELIESSDTDHFIKKDDMKTFGIMLACGLLSGLLCGCVASRIQKPYVKETITHKDGTVIVRETSADSIDNGGLDLLPKAAPTR